MVGPTPMGIPNTQLPNLMVPEAVAAGIGFGTQGLEASDITGFPACTANWCNLFATYTGDVAPLELQTLNQSCPSLTGTGITCTGQQGSTGPLPALLYFSAPNFPTVYELYYQDWLLAYSTSNNYCRAANGANYTSGQCNIIQPQYLAAFKFVRPCVYPFLCSPTNFTTITYPSSPPNIGGITGAGNTYTDPLFGTTGVRVTDANYDPFLFGTANNSYTVSNGGDDGDIWFSTSDMLALIKSAAANSYLEGLNPTTMALSRPYAAATTGCPIHAGNCSTTGGWATGDIVGFSLVNPCKLYDIANSGPPVLSSYTFGSDVVPWANPCSSGISGPPAQTTIFNFIENSPAACVGQACNCLPSDFGSATWASFGETVTGDTLFGAAFSSTAYHNGGGTGQNSGFYVVVYSPVKGCMSYNTLTRAIQADVGWAGGSGLTCGGSQCTGTAILASTYTIHTVKMDKSGDRFALGSGTCVSGVCPSSNPFIWVVGTTTVYDPGATTTASGHWNMGSHVYIDRPGTPLYQFYQRTLPAGGPPASKTAINTLPVPPCSPQVDQHNGYTMANFNDTVPFAFAMTTASILNGGLIPFDPLPCAWVAEIDMADMNGDGFVHRQALTFNTGWSWNFDAANSIFACSPSGKFCSFGTDWLNQLRNVGGNSTSCIPNGPVWAAGKSYASVYVINPQASHNPGNYSFSSGGSCTAGGTEPATWNQTPTGTQADGTCTWTNLGVPSGVNSCGTDVVIVKTQ